MGALIPLLLLQGDDLAPFESLAGDLCLSQQARRHVPSASVIRDDSDSLAVVLRQDARNRRTAVWRESDPLSNTELEHAVVGA